MQKICLIIPCFNESKRLPVDAFETFYSSHKNIHFCFVNDGSRDNTLHVLHSFRRRRENRVSVLDLGNNYGKGEAVRLGILSAIEQNYYDYVGYLDADLSTPLGEIISLLEELNKRPACQMAFRSRVARMGAIIKRSSKRH